MCFFNVRLIGFFGNVFYLSGHISVCCNCYACMWVLRLLQLWLNTVQGSLAGIRVCKHTAAKRSPRPAYHLHDNLLTAHHMMMRNARLPLAYHLYYLLVSFSSDPLFLPSLPSFFLSHCFFVWFCFFVHLFMSYLFIFFWPDLLFFTHEPCPAHHSHSIVFLFCLQFFPGLIFPPFFIQ